MCENSDDGSDFDSSLLVVVRDNVRCQKRKLTTLRITSTKLKKKSAVSGKPSVKDLSYDDSDTHNINLPDFYPSRPPEHHKPMALRNDLAKAVDFFSFLQTNCKHTNTYAWQKINSNRVMLVRMGLGRRQTQMKWRNLLLNSSCKGSDISPLLEHQIALSWPVGKNDDFTRLFHCLVVNVTCGRSNNETDKLRKVRSHLDMFKSKCRELYQPD